MMTTQAPNPQGTAIHDQGYRHYVGQRVPHGRAWWVIARSHILTSVQYRPFLILMLVAWAPFVFRAVQIYVSSTNLQVAEFLATTPDTFRDFLSQQRLFVFLVTIGQAGLIAEDRRTNALQLYLSKPLTRVEYILGKLIPPLAYVLAVTLVPAVLLLLLQIVFAGSLTFLRANLFLLPAITLFSLIQALLSAFAILALSSLTKSRRFVSIMYAAVIFFTAAMYGALRGITGSRTWSVIAPGEMLDVIANAIFRSRGEPPVPVYVAVIVVFGVIGLSMLILERRIRAVEVVA
jgi:ABC-2 type transport system permease protein